VILGRAKHEFARPPSGRRWCSGCRSTRGHPAGPCPVFVRPLAARVPHACRRAVRPYAARASRVYTDTKTVFTSFGRTLIPPGRSGLAERRYCPWRRPYNVLGVSCAAGPACRSRSGAAVAAEELQRHDWRPATAVTPSRWRQRRQLGCRAEAGPHQLHTKVRPRPSCAEIHLARN
jgi:hypothetical protein